MREIVLDTETTGLNYKAGDRVIEVGCVELLNHVPTGNTLQFYCSTEKQIPEDVKSVHGLTNEFLKKYPTFKNQSKKFLDFIKKDTLVIHNADFDVGFINNELQIIGLSKIKNEIVDTLYLARKKLNTRIANLDYLCKRFSIDLSGREKHGALKDCFLLADVYIELLGGKQTSLNLDKEAKSLDNAQEKTKKTPSLAKKIILEESIVESHKKFIKNIKNALWNKMDY